MSDKSKLKKDLSENKTRMLVQEMKLLTNALLSRESLLSTSTDGLGRNYDEEFGYPKFPLSPGEYNTLYQEESIAKRIVEVFPQECWSDYPELTQNQRSASTESEKKWKQIEKKINPWHYCHRADTLSGIGRFGVLFLGVSDGETDLSRSIRGIEYDPLTGEYIRKGKGYEILYLRAFEEDLVQISKYETDLSNVRYGQPIEYRIQFADPNNRTESSNEDTSSGSESTIAPRITTAVHWTRIIHIADNRKSSEIYGIPRMEQVGRRICDIRKILGGSAEMFWRGAFPGYSFEALPDLAQDSELDEESVKVQFDEYSKGLKRYLALTGMTVKTLLPQIGDPSNHMLVQLQMICIALGVPMRIFMGTEAGHLASQEDSITWNRRLKARQTNYLNPLVIHPFIQRLILIGCLPVFDFTVTWKDINNSTDADKADIGLKITQSVLQYVSSGAEEILPVQLFFTKVLGWSDQEAADAIKDIAKGGKLTKKIWQKDQMAGKVPGKAKDPTKKTGKNGRTNGLGK